MLQGLTQFCVAFLDFFEQPDVLDRDDRLIGEGLEELDLFLGERLPATPQDRSHQRVSLA